jgi:hypothetical protein
VSVSRLSVSRLTNAQLSDTRLSNALLINIADLVGTFVFAAEGALAAIRGNLDVFGVMVLSFVTAVGGGIIRDVLLGRHRPRHLATGATPRSRLPPVPRRFCYTGGQPTFPMG